MHMIQVTWGTGGVRLPGSARMWAASCNTSMTDKTGVFLKAQQKKHKTRLLTWFAAATGGFSTRGGKVGDMSWLPNKAVTKSFKPKSFQKISKNLVCALSLRFWLLSFKPYGYISLSPWTLCTKVLLPKQLFTNLIIHNHTNSLQTKCLPSRRQFPPPLLPRK